MVLIAAAQLLYNTAPPTHTHPHTHPPCLALSLTWPPQCCIFSDITEEDFTDETKYGGKITSSHLTNRALDITSLTSPRARKGFFFTLVKLLFLFKSIFSLFQTSPASVLHHSVSNASSLPQCAELVDQCAQLYTQCAPQNGLSAFVCGSNLFTSSSTLEFYKQRLGIWKQIICQKWSFGTT